MEMKRFLYVLGGSVALFFFSFIPPEKKSDPEFISLQNKWVDSVFSSLSPDERLAQLFMVAAYSNKDLKHVKEIRDLVADYRIGGLIWMQGGPVAQGKLANYYQTLAKTPLLYSIDGEWGLAMRLDSTIRYPKQMTLGAIQNDSLIYEMGRQIARECKRLGIHINFAPVADVNNNPLNPVIGQRSFGENKYKVARKSEMYMRGLQDEHVMACAKHFPGHGDTDSDSHLGLPLLNHSRARLDSLELYPFRYLFDRGLSTVMVAHLNIPTLDSGKNQASSLSPQVVNDLLKTRMGFKGLVFTDALNMKGVAKFNEAGMVDVKALLAGNDMLLFSGNVPKAIEEIKKAIQEGKITQEDIDKRCKKILQAKYWCGLNRKQEIVTRFLSKDIVPKSGEELNDKLAEAAITLLKNENKFIPLRGTDTLKLVEVSIGVDESNTLGSTLRNFAYVEHVGITHTAEKEELTEAFEKINNADVVVLQLNKTTAKPDNNYGLGKQSLRLADSIARLKPTILVVSTNPYVLNKLISIKPYKTILVAYEYLPTLLRASAHAIIGTTKVNGRLPVSTNFFKAESGLELEALPQQATTTLKENRAANRFAKVDSIALAGIREKAYPGCQIVAMQNGEVIYQKSFGAFTYAYDAKPVDNGTLYDLASLTKIAATSLALMKLEGDSLFDHNKTLGDYLPYLKGSNKETLYIDEVLSHQAGLVAWIPFYLKSLEKNGRYKPGYYSKKSNGEFTVPVARNLFTTPSFKDSIYKRIVESKVENRGKYVYSDLGYYFMQQIIEEQSHQKLEDYVKDLYFKVGIGLTYRPLNYLSKYQIAPTENDEKFRKQIVQGFVHDPGAALLGGVAGHAGLFGNALDVAKLMQLYLNKGELNGVRLLDSNVVKDFTSCRFCPNNRRGLCFEKPELDPKKDNPVVSDCSPQSFGHAGFTGTFAWADPRNKLVVVFLSNRVYPNAEDNKLTKLGIRGKIHKAFYEALNK